MSDNRIIEFICGSISFDGYWWGEEPRDKRSKFWWRTVLREYDDAQTKELDSLKKVYNDLAESHAKQVIENQIQAINYVHQMDKAKRERDVIESELLKAKESNDSMISILAALKLDALEGRELLRQSLFYSKNDANFHDVINHNHIVEEFLNKKP